MIRALCTFAIFSVGMTGVFAQSDVNAARKEFMKKYGSHGYSMLNRMVRDQMPYDQGKVDQALEHFLETAAKIPSLFPAGGYQGPIANSNYYSATKAFENPADMKARADKLAKAVADAKGQIKNLDSLKAVWTVINKDHCDSCHQEYRLRKQS